MIWAFAPFLEWGNRFRRMVAPGSGRDERSEKRKRGGAHGEPITESSKLLEGLCHAAAATTVGFAATPSTALAEGEDASAGEIKRIRSCCRACGKVECGVWVTVQNGRAVKVEGDQSSFQSSGNCCGKSQSSIQAAYHPIAYTIHEAHESQGRGPRLAAHHVGRGDADHR